MIFLSIPSLLMAQVFYKYDNDIRVTGLSQNEYLQPWAGGINSPQFQKADLNNNGTDELVIYERSTDVFKVYEYREGRYIFNAEMASIIPSLPMGWVVFVDYNGDGLKDIFTNGDRGMMVYKNISQPNTNARWEKIADPLLSQSTTTMINIIGNLNDIPAITDVDGDGDLDILVYNFAIGGFIRYHKNLSMERYGNRDALEFEFANRFWGGFEECDCFAYTFLPETCADIGFDFGRVEHPGGKSILLLDANGNGLMDFLGGHEQCNELYFLENEGTSEMAIMKSFSWDFPNAKDPAIIKTFPAGYYEDIDRDGRKDLLVAPNIEFNPAYETDFANSSWYYRDTGTGNAPDFSLVKRNFLQDEMIDLGENAMPVIIDLNGNGKSDLLVSSNGWNSDGRFYGRLVWFENTGTLQQPALTLRDENFLEASSLRLVNPRISFADINNDGRADLIFSGFSFDSGTMKHYVYYQGNHTLKYNEDQKASLNLPVQFNDTPAFADVDGDGNPDLLVGKRDGSLYYYRNAGNGFFNLVTRSYLGIGRDFSLTRLNLSPSVSDFNSDGKLDLFTTDASGYITLIRDFTALSEEERPIRDSLIFYNNTIKQAEAFKMGMYSWLSLGYLYNDNFPVMVAGNAAGGINVMRFDTERNPVSGQVFITRLYPNPVEIHDKLILEVNLPAEGVIYTVLGQKIRDNLSFNRNTLNEIEIGGFDAGVYLLRIHSNAGSKTLKFIVRQ
ncbi:MAG: T9SS type A sorting domain-containing protein [Cyclobacteriaceae bacterium]|nr:T9SS type A sorting domain-containing protein [Cyclobacteriaceae bacterium]